MPYREEVLQVAASAPSQEQTHLPGALVRARRISQVPSKQLGAQTWAFRVQARTFSAEAEAARASGRASRRSPSLVLAPGQPGSAALPAARPANFQPSKGKLYSMRHSAAEQSWGFFLLSCASLSIQQTETLKWWTLKWEEEKRRNPNLWGVFEQVFAGKK